MNLLPSIVAILAGICFAVKADVSFMPKYLDFDSLRIDLPKEPSEILDPNLPYFKQFPLDSGKICPKNGILISDKTAAEYVFYKLGYQRLGMELKMAKYLLKEYYEKSLSVEKTYQDRIKSLEKENKRSWLEKNQGYIGFIFGIVTAILTEWAVLRVK